MFDNLYFMIGLGVLVIIIITGVFFLVKSQRKQKKEQISTVDVTDIINAFGNENIINIETVQKRVRIQVKDTQKVDLEALKEASNGIFVSGDKIVLTFKNDTEAIVSSLRSKI